MDPTVGAGIARRQMLAAMAMVGGAALVPGLRHVALPSLFRDGSAPGWSTDVAGTLTAARFAPYVGTPFTVSVASGGPRTVTLEEVTTRNPHPADRPGLQGDAFSLIFRGEGPMAFGGGMYTLRHRELGAFTLFLVPVDRRGDAQDYQAVIDTRRPGH